MVGISFKQKIMYMMSGVHITPLKLKTKKMSLLTKRKIIITKTPTVTPFLFCFVAYNAFYFI